MNVLKSFPREQGVDLAFCQSVAPGLFEALDESQTLLLLIFLMSRSSSAGAELPVGAVREFGVIITSLLRAAASGT
jgi:hypothetical protein